MSEINNLIIERLNKKNNLSDIPSGWFLVKVEADFFSNEDAVLALQRVKEVIEIIAMTKHNTKDWPNIEGWKKILPNWLLKSFRSEYTKEEVEKLLKNNQPRKEWTLEDWEFYIQNKVWEWWNGKVEDNKLLIEVIVDGHPFSIYELESILILSGATFVKMVE